MKRLTLKKDGKFYLVQPEPVTSPVQASFLENKMKDRAVQMLGQYEESDVKFEQYLIQRIAVAKADHTQVQLSTELESALAYYRSCKPRH